MQVNTREKMLSALGSVAVVALLGFVLLAGLTVEMNRSETQPMLLLDIRAQRPEEHRPKPVVRPPRPSQSAGRAPSRKALKKTNLPAPAAAPMLPPVPFPMIPVPRILAPAASTGASDQAGQGGGAGGNGAGDSGYGDGDGDGGDDVAPRHIKGRLKYSDLPSALSAGGGRSVAVRYDVNEAGTVEDCVVTKSSGSADLDRLTCQLIERRFRFDPSRDHDGHPVRSTIEETHSWIDDAGDTHPDG